MGSAEAINQCARIIVDAQKNERIIAVVSAMSGVTDILIESVEQAVAGNQKCFLENKEKLRDRHLQTIEKLQLMESPALVEAPILAMIEEFSTLCHAVHVLGEATSRVLDAVVSLGERMSHHLLAAAVRKLGISSLAVDAGDFLITDDHFQHANPDFKNTKKQAKEVLLPLIKKSIVPIVTGFCGRTKDGITTTLGRGGSDYSAAIIGKVIDAKKVIIWTDVTGVMSTDPRIDATARTIPLLAYSEVAELAYFGAKVLHPKSIRPSVEDGAELWVRNTFAPEEKGTQIVLDSPQKAGAIRAVTSIPKLSLITIEGRGMLGIPGVAARAFAATARSNTNILMISQASSEQSICFLIREHKVEKVIATLREEFSEELASREIDDITSLNHVVIITAVGAGMRYTPGVAGKIFSALGENKINVIAIAQGSSECSISFVIAMEDEKNAVRCIHRLTEN